MIFAFGKNRTKQESMEEQGKHEHSLPHEISSEQKRINEAAHDQAEHDIDEDPDLSIHSPNDDLDEGELARLSEDEMKMILHKF